MGFFDKALKTAKNVGGSIASSAANVGSTVGTAAQDNAELNSLKMQINVIEQELDAAYAQIGKKYVDYVAQTGDMGNLDVADLLAMMDPLLRTINCSRRCAVRAVCHLRRQRAGVRASPGPRRPLTIPEYAFWRFR